MRSGTRSWMIAGALAGCAWSASARADQCAVLDKTTAAHAVDALHRYSDVVSYCEPCGELAPGEPVDTTGAEARRFAGGFEVVLDHQPIDLAYTYVRTSSHRYENLAALVGCPTRGVSPSLAIDDATSTGVLIHADPTPVRSAEPAAERVALPPSPPAPPAPAPAIYIVTPASNAGVGWDLVLAACLVTSGVWWLGAGLRRRRAMRPRATEL